jgi:hypothetical protein
MGVYLREKKTKGGTKNEDRDKKRLAQEIRIKRE